MNFTLFPLYHQLLIKVPSVDVSAITLAERTEIVNYMKKHTDRSEVIYALIKAYSLDHGIQVDLPYNMVSLKSGHKVDLSLLPPPLQHILLLCVRIK